MFSKVFSGTVSGVNGRIIQVEVDLSNGLPVFEMVGYLSSQVKEAKERVRIALKNSGFSLPPKRTTINLSPADLRKESTAFDLSIAVAILINLGLIPESNVLNTLIIGELSLNGKVNKVNGVLPIVYAALHHGFQRCIVPKENAGEGAVINGIEVIGVESLLEVVEFLNGRSKLEAEWVNIEKLLKSSQSSSILDFSDVAGQTAVKRAVIVAVSGMHHFLMRGSPGSGKTMIAKRIPTIMPELSFKESIEISKIYSVVGLLDEKQILIMNRPFRAPHHTSTIPALIGGGRNARPGEISLGSGGVLFLDELPEFNKNALETLKQPLEDREVMISRLNHSFTYPANFMLVAAMNPCNCGYYPDRAFCKCTSSQINRYLGRISQPLLDRIDICVETLKMNYEELGTYKNPESSAEMRKKVAVAREMQICRYKDEKISFNSELTPEMMRKYCNLGKNEKALMEKVFINLNLSARAYHRILKVSRTIADLDGLEKISLDHLSEAICYRSLDKNNLEE